MFYFKEFRNADKFTCSDFQKSFWICLSICFCLFLRFLKKIGNTNKAATTIFIAYLSALRKFSDFYMVILFVIYFYETNLPCWISHVKDWRKFHFELMHRIYFSLSGASNLLFMIQNCIVQFIAREMNIVKWKF